MFPLPLARLPVKTLQLEQMAVEGSAEEPSVVASRMRLVFSTLEVCSFSPCIYLINVYLQEKKCSMQTPANKNEIDKNEEKIIT